MNLIGRCEMDSNFDNPFTVADRILKEGGADISVLDFHAEATSEKGALAWYLGRAGPGLCGGPTPMSPLPIARFFPRAPALSPTWG